ncbi:MAG: pantoate--beta-alanine ligase [Cyclobacteriaceae bacterium]
MEIFTQIAPLKAYLKEFKNIGKVLGLVPTMGALHEGHSSLIQASKAHNDVTVSTIFINPTQFNNKNDLLKYPRSIEKDIELLTTAGCDVLFHPTTAEIYPEKSILKLDFGDLDKIMEGHFRPGHFSGVGLVVSKLFNIVTPDNAYFGQKDWQQFAVIQKLVSELNFNVALHSVETLREEDGLALSSRNRRLNISERKKANVFYKALTQAKEGFFNGETITGVREKVRNMVDGIDGVKLEYFEVADSKNLNLLDDVGASKDAIMCIAGYVGEVRLIDNMFVA